MQHLPVNWCVTLSLLQPNSINWVHKIGINLPKTLPSASVLLFSFTFDSDVDSLVDWHLGLDQNATQVGPLVCALLHVCEPQCAVLKHHLTMIIRQLHAVLQPLNGVIWVPNHTTRYIGISARHCGDVSHGSNSRWTWRHGEEREGMEGGDREKHRGWRKGEMRWGRSWQNIEGSHGDRKGRDKGWGIEWLGPVDRWKGRLVVPPLLKSDRGYLLILA